MPRFAAPRSLTPSPERNPAAATRHYIAPVDSDSDSDSETESSVSASSDEDVTSHTIAAPPIPPKADPEAARLADALASIRLRTRHHDAYEVWATATTKDALTAAKITHAEHARAREAAMANAQRAAKAAETQVQNNAVEAAAALVRSHAAAAAKSLEEFRTHWAAKEKAVKSSIDKAIREEEERIAELERKAKEREEKERKEKEEALKKKLEAEKKTREEAERKQREADEKKKQAEEAKRKAEEEKKAEEQREKAKEEQKLKEEEEQKQKEEREKAAIQAIGMSTSQDDWKTARELLVFLKTGPMAAVKGNKALKSQWSTIRRSITPKIGQLTADEGTIDRVTEQICGILQPTPALPLEVYVAGLSALSKAILLQAETEVTAVQKAAIPLAGVTGRLLARLPDFSRIFWARLVQRSGAWCIPCSVPTHEPSGDAMDEKARKKAMGLKDGEAPAEYISRVSGVMRLYFEVMKISTQSPTPLEQEWRLPRAWAWATRLLGRPGMMASTAAPLCVFALLEVLGSLAKDVWGVQWVKLLALFYAASTQGIGAPMNDGKDRPLLGGTTPEGRAARVRVQLEIERSLASS